MHHRRPFLRHLVTAGLVAAGFVAVVGGLALRGPGVVAVAVAGALAACLGWGTARESTAPARRSNTEAAVLAAAWTVGVLLVLSGASVLAGGVAAAMLAGVAAVVALAVWVARTPKDDEGRSAATAPTAHGNLAALRPHAAPLLHGRPATRAGDLPPVRTMSNGELGREWLESAAGLSSRVDAATRTAVVRRRQETLDELERRDPEGFQRWLATGPADRDPADFVRKRTAGEPTAGTDAA